MRHLEHMALILRHHGQHVFNPLHIFCRLKGLGLDSLTAAKWAARYERYFYRYTPLV